MTTPAVGPIDVFSHPAYGSAEPVDHNSGFASTGRGAQPPPTAKQPAAVGRLNSCSSRTNEQLRSLVADAMCQLPFEYRAVIYRAYYQGWTTARIADDLKITEAAVKSRLHDGVHTLRLIFRATSMTKPGVL
jgi:DNA-directed RNA polymerase specialized sigma24 family protein